MDSTTVDYERLVLELTELVAKLEDEVDYLQDELRDARIEANYWERQYDNLEGRINE